MLDNSKFHLLHQSFHRLCSQCMFITGVVACVNKLGFFVIVKCVGQIILLYIKIITELNF